jgi:adenine-specific DNA-methyltransferase
VALDLSQQDIDQIKGLLDRGEHLPDRFRATLFGDASALELIWPGKTSRVETAVLPFQSIEHVDEPRQETASIPSLFDVDEASGRQVGGWTNKLVWGDNRLILSSLVYGPMRQQIEDAGGLKLIYIDPPFDVGADFSMDIDVGGEQVTKAPSVIEEVAYRDTWGRGTDSFLSMLHGRVALMHSLLADDGAFFLHCDWRVSGPIRLVLDEVFGPNNFRNAIVWEYAGKGMTNARSTLVRNHATIYLYAKSDSFVPNLRSGEVSQSVRQRFGRYMDEDNKITFGSLRSSGDALELTKATRSFVKEHNRQPTDDDIARDYSRGSLLRDVWKDISIIRENKTYSEYVGYPTQKPEALLDRVLRVGSNENDLVADFFAGSGTTAAVAERLGRKWIAADLGRFAVHTTRKRLINVQRALKSESKPYRAFEVLNLGAYERQHFVGVDVNVPLQEQDRQSQEREEAYLSLILRAYAGERATGTPPFHGVKGGTAVLVGPIDAPVTERQIREAIDAAVSASITRVDVLGFEFEMGLKPLLQDEAKDQGVNLALRYIPNDVFDNRAVKAGDVKFHDVAYVEFKPVMSGCEVTVSLTDFAVFYRQEDADAAAAGLKNRGSRVVVDEGQVVKVSKDRNGIITREVLTSVWTDWIDYWAVDFDYGSQPEVIRVLEGGVEKQVRTGRFIFENRWQSFRTKQDRELELTSAPHEYTEAGTYKVAVKVIDIFGNDTTRVVPVRVRS